MEANFFLMFSLVIYVPWKNNLQNDVKFVDLNFDLLTE